MQVKSALPSIVVTVIQVPPAKHGLLRQESGNAQLGDWAGSQHSEPRMLQSWQFGGLVVHTQS